MAAVDCMPPLLGTYPTETWVVLRVMSRGSQIVSKPQMIIERMSAYYIQLELIVKYIYSSQYLQLYVLDPISGETIPRYIC